MIKLFRLRGFDNPSATLFQKWISRRKCPVCGVNIDLKSYENASIWIGPSARNWTDVLANIDGLLFHERVIGIIEKEGLTGFRAHPVTIEKIESSKTPSELIPKYYIIEITGRVDIDPDELDDEGGSVCKFCFYRSPKDDSSYRWSPKRIIPKMETWDGGDFVQTRNLRNAYKYCSRRFIDLACKHKWTNFIFGESLPGVGLWEKPPKGGISYFDPNWFDKLCERVKLRYPDMFK